DILLKNSLKKRVDLIAQIQKSAQKSVNLKDWSLQIVTLNVLKVENERLYNYILDLPAPKNLSQALLEQYNTLLKKQAAPFLQASTKTAQQLATLWSHDSSIQSLAKDYSLAPYPLNQIVEAELTAVLEAAPNNKSASLKNALSSSRKK